MTPESPEIANLIVLRDALISRRRQIAETVTSLRQDSGYAGDASAGSNFGADLLTVQMQIEAVERAIADEGELVANAPAQDLRWPEGTGPIEVA